MSSASASSFVNPLFEMADLADISALTIMRSAFSGLNIFREVRRP